MKKVIASLAALPLSVVIVSAASAGAIDNKTNWSAEYIRTLNRNAATDYADIAAYNPAGTVKLTDGMTINASAQYLGKDYANNITVAPSTVLGLESDEPSVVPGLFAVYNEGLVSIFGSVTVVGGGGKVEYSQGNASTFTIASNFLGQPLCSGTCVYPGPQQLTGESFYVGYGLGAALDVHEIFSFSLGLRYVDAHKEAQGSATVLDGALSNPYTTTVSYEQNGDGWGGIFGVNIAPNDKLNIAMRYETKTDIEFDTTVLADGPIPVLPALGIIDGSSPARDLPAIFAMGISYWLTPQLRVEANFTHYFNEEADWEGAEDNVDDGFDAGIALEYHFSDSFLASIGYLRTETGIDPEYMLPENPELDANTIGGGVAFAITENFHTNLALGYVFYEEDSYSIVEYEKNILFAALGLEYRFAF